MHKFNETDNPLWLFTVEEYKQLPDGIVLECIDGTFATKGTDHIDMDTRFGYTAFGIRSPETHPSAELFVTFRLKNG